jgi:hypothetical protein
MAKPTIEEQHELKLAELGSLKEQYRSLGEKITSLVQTVKELELALNKDKLGDIEWLIKNPTAEGQYEALRKWVKDQYGSEYAGVHPSGYRRNKDYTILVQNFNFCLYQEDKENAKKNFKHFVTNYLKYITPIDDAVVFCYGTGQYSGIHQLGYDVDKDQWFTFVTRYSRDSDRVYHKNLDAVLDYCVRNQPED